MCKPFKLVAFLEDGTKYTFSFADAKEADEKGEEMMSKGYTTYIEGMTIDTCLCCGRDIYAEIGCDCELGC